MLVDKPAGPTSHDVVARVRRALKTRAVGHTGTLDPFATGLLVVLVGRATRLARFVSQQPKTYVATARLGVATTTDDCEGEPVLGPAADPRPSDFAGHASTTRERGWPLGPSRRAIEDALDSFRGPQKQRPPVFSAKRVEGERSYTRARRGEPVELAEVDIHVYAVELEEYNYPDLRFRTTVSAGTYVRAIGRDLGLRLGTRSHLTALRREAIGALRVEDALPLDAITATALRSPLEVLGHLARVEVTESDAMAVGFGKPIRPATAELAEGLCAVVSDGRLIAVGVAHGGTVQPEVVLEAAG